MRRGTHNDAEKEGRRRRERGGKEADVEAREEVDERLWLDVSEIP